MYANKDAEIDQKESGNIRQLKKTGIVCGVGVVRFIVVGINSQGTFYANYL